MPPRSRVSAKLRSTRSARSLNASLATPECSRARLLYTARRAASSPRQRWTPAAFFSAIRLFQTPSSRSFKPSREWYPGGFKWSSQHLDGGVRDGHAEAAFGPVGAGRVALAGPAGGGAARGPAAVLDGDRGGAVQRGRGG